MKYRNYFFIYSISPTVHRGRSQANIFYVFSFFAFQQNISQTRIQLILGPPFYVQLYWRHESSGSTFGPLMGIQGKMFMSWHLTVKLIAASPTTGETRDKCIMSAADSMSTTMLFHQTNEAFIRRVLDDTMPPTTHTHMLSTVVCLGFSVFFWRRSSSTCCKITFTLLKLG